MKQMVFTVVILLSSNFFTSYAYPSYLKEIDVSKAVDFYNRIQGIRWKASTNGFSGKVNLSALKSRFGLFVEENFEKFESFSNSNESNSHEYDDLPSEYDARKAYPNSSTISSIKDQSNCGSCWAVSVASSFSDRLYIASEGNYNYNMSIEQLLACSEKDHGCKGGRLDTAWSYIEKYGLGTGGDYGSNEGCQPYSIPPTKGRNSSGKAETPSCSKDPCPITFKAKNLHEVPPHPDEIRKEIYEHGPVPAGFLVYLSFMFYKRGTYMSPFLDIPLGWHAGRIIGWGEENGWPYWIVANSWGADWGEHGTFKIMRGIDHCFIESNIFAGEPDL